MAEALADVLLGLRQLHPNKTQGQVLPEVQGPLARNGDASFLQRSQDRTVRIHGNTGLKIMDCPGRGADAGLVVATCVGGDPFVRQHEVVELHVHVCLCRVGCLAPFVRSWVPGVRCDAL